MVYGYLIMGAVLVGSAVWGAKYYTDSGGSPEPDSESKENEEHSTKKPGGEGTGVGDRTGTVSESPGSTTTQPYITTTTTTKKKPTKKKKIRPNKAGYVGNGWWQSNIYFGWEPDSFPNLEWGNGIKPPKRPTISDALNALLASYNDERPPKVHAPATDWLEDLQKLFVEGKQPGKPTEGFAGWMLSETTTTTEKITSPPPLEVEYVSQYEPIVVTVSKDHLKPPPGGWGVDYNPYFYFNG